jgi:hypothetical protein
MSFQASNFTVSVILLMAFTIGMIIVRGRKPLENNWPLYYWMIILLFTLTWESWDERLILVGAIAGLILRFEFLGESFVKMFRFVEICVWVYILYAGLHLVMTV